MDVLGSSWAKVTLLVVVGLFAVPVSADDRLAEALLQGWSEALKSGGTISGRFTTYRYHTSLNQFGEGVGAFRRDESGRISVTEKQKSEEPLSALVPWNRRTWPTGIGETWTDMATPTFTFTDEVDGWYVTDVDRNGHIRRMKWLDRPSALKPENSRTDWQLVFWPWPAEMTATGAICMPLFLPEVETVQFLEPRSQKKESGVTVVRCRVLIPRVGASLTYVDQNIALIFPPESPLPSAISNESGTDIYRWAFHDLEYDSR